MPVQTQIQQRRGTAASWTSTNPTLAAGEIGFESDTNRFKIGNGSTAWASLSYWVQDPVTTKGDLYTFSTTDARLAVGANGETLVADSSTSTGLRYQTVPQQNSLINSNYSVWQRGTSLAVTSTSTSFYGADRWQIFSASTGRTVSRQLTGDTTNLPNIQYCQRVARDSGNTNTAAILPAYSMETADAIKFAGQPVVFTFYARRGANYSGSSNVLNVVGRSGTGTDQNLNAGYTGSADFISTGVTLTTTWQRFTTGGTVSASATELGFQFNFTPTGTAGANDWFEITGLQLEIGSTPTAYRPYSATIQGELSACMRYYQRLNSVTAYGGIGGIARVTNTGSSGVSAWFPALVPMRVTPTALDSGGAWQLYGTGAFSLSSIILNAENPTSLSFLATAGTATANTIQTVIANNNAASYLGWSAEL